MLVRACVRVCCGTNTFMDVCGRACVRACVRAHERWQPATMLCNAACLLLTRKPQPCFAVSTACFAPRALYDLIQLSMSSLTGLNVAGLELFTPLFQFSAVQAGSPSLTNVAMLKWVNCNTMQYKCACGCACGSSVRVSGCESSA